MKLNTIRIILLAIVFIAIVAWVANYLYFNSDTSPRSRAAVVTPPPGPEDVLVFFNPTSFIQSPGGTFTINITAQSQTPTGTPSTYVIQGGYVDVLFDKTKVRVSNIVYPNGSLVPTSNTADTNSKLTDVNNLGKMHLQVESQDPDGYTLLANTPFANVTFESLSNLNSLIQIQPGSKFFKLNTTTAVLEEKPSSIAMAEVNPAATITPIPPSPTRTNTPVPPSPTRTNTPIPPSPTRTNTPIPPSPTRTNTPVPPSPTRTNTPIPPSPTRTNTPTPTSQPCLCNLTSNTCSSTCTFHGGNSGSVSCSLNSNIFSSVPTAQDRTNWCARNFRTAGDADGNATSIGEIEYRGLDYFYYVRVVNGGIVPPVINADFNGDGEVGRQDRDIIMLLLTPTP